MKIKSNCCCFGKGLVEEVHVLEQDCPIKREEGKRTYESNDQQITDCTCIFFSILSGGHITNKCDYYKGTKKERKSGEYMVDCAYQ